MITIFSSAEFPLPSFLQTCHSSLMLSDACCAELKHGGDFEHEIQHVAVKGPVMFQENLECERDGRLVPNSGNAAPSQLTREVQLERTKDHQGFHCTFSIRSIMRESWTGTSSRTGLPRSEQHSDYAKSLWYGLVRRLLACHHRVGNIKMPVRLQIADTTTAMDPRQPCHHLPSQVVHGANQYGRWSKCLACKEKLSYEAYSSTNPRTVKGKKSGEVLTYIPKVKDMPKITRKGYAAVEANQGITPGQLQEALQQQSQTLVQGISSALAPIAVGQQHLIQAVSQAAGSQMPVTPQVPVVQRRQEGWQFPETPDEEMKNPNSMTNWGQQQ